MAGDPASKLEQIVRDLGKLEINTIVMNDGGTTGRPMADPRHALHDIARCYGRFLNGVRAQHVGSGLADAEDLPRDLRGSKVVFEALDSAAASALLELGSALEPDAKTVLTRIKKMSGWLAAVLTKRGDNDFSREELNAEDRPLGLLPHELSYLRKIWELGSQIIVMQTTITMTGDVVTRVERGFATEAHARLHGFHNDGVRVATQTWASIVSVVREVATGLINLVR